MSCTTHHHACPCREAEFERLREALESIARPCPLILKADDPDSADVLWESTKRRRKIAREALKSAAKE